MEIAYLTLPSELAIVAILGVWGLRVLRLPFFPDTISWDESSLIVTGQGVLDGYLPYDRLWQMKPPLAFALFAGAIALFGKTIIDRFGGYLCVVLTSYLVYRASYLITRNTVPAVVAALVSTTVISLFEPELMAEILCLVPLSAALLLLSTDDIKPVRALLVGLLIGIAVMVRTNLAVLALAAGAFIAFHPPASPISRSFTRGFAFATGVVIVIAATIIPYLIAGQFQLWFDSVVRAGIAFSSNRHSLKILPILSVVGLALVRMDR